jgi:hypothetical protein
MMAQLQSMDYRQQQNALAQLQMQKLQREAQMQGALSGVLTNPNFNVMDPNAYKTVIQTGNLPEGLSIIAAQRQAAALAAQEEQARRTGLYQTGMLDVARAKLPMEKEKLRQEGIKESHLAKSAELTGEKTALEKDAEMLKNAENQAAKIVMAGGKGYDKFYSGLHDSLKGILPPQYDEEALSNFTTQMATVQENLKRAHEYELVDRINPQTGLKEKIAVPKYAPEKGGKPVAGTQGIESPTYSFSQGPGGTMFRGNPKTGTGELFTPGQPGMPMPTNAMAPAPLLPQTSFTNAPPLPAQTAPVAPPQGMLAPRARATGVEGLGVTPAPLGSKERDIQETGAGVLRTLNYNPDTGVDTVESTLARAPSGVLQAKGTDISRAFGRDSAAATADAELKRLSASLAKTYSGDKLAAQGFSDKDAKRVEQLTADLGNSDLTIGERRGAYRDLKREVTRQLGIEYKNPYDPQGIKVENVMRARVEESPTGFTVTDPDGGVHTFDDRKKAAEFLTYVQRMTVGKK